MTGQAIFEMRALDSPWREVIALRLIPCGDTRLILDKTGERT
jgi:hypothetical protein